MKRAAIYARFSSDKQNERSCQDQIDLCVAWAEKNDLRVVASFADHAVSGASTANRLELGRLMRSARSRDFDVVLSEALDRISRDQADLAGIKKQLAFVDVSIQTVQDGEVGAMHIGLKGLMGEMYLADLAQKTRRGLRARLTAGSSAGGRSYGYDLAEKGQFVINEREAVVVRRIFAEYLAGRTPRNIVSRLNGEGIPGPRGGKWNASTINGSRTRQNGILQNSLYIGEMVWNRQRFIKDPDTGRRVSRPNPPEEWVRREVAGLRIVDDQTFIAVNASKARKSAHRPEFSKRPKHLFSGLLKCSECGSGFVIVGRARLGCSGRRERGDCSNGTRIALAEVEDRVLKALDDHLADPDAVAAFVTEYIAERHRREQALVSDRAGKEARVRDISVAIERIVDQVVAGTQSVEMMERMKRLDAERNAMKAELQASPEPDAVRLHPGAAAAYRRIVVDLQAHMAARDDEQLKEKCRELVTRIEIGPRNAKGPPPVTVYGPLAEVLLSSRRHPPMVGNVGCGSPQQPFTIRLVA